MPQTMEHLQIVSLLRTPKVMVVLTKIDLVDSTIRETVTLEIKEFLEKMGFGEAPIVPFQPHPARGIHQIRRTIDDLVSGISYDRDPEDSGCP